MRPLTISDDDKAHRIRVRRRVSYKLVSWGILRHGSAVRPALWVGSMLLKVAPLDNGLLPSQEAAHCALWVLIASSKALL